MTVQAGWRVKYLSKNTRYWNGFQVYLGWGIMQPFDLVEIMNMDPNDIEPHWEVSMIKAQRIKEDNMVNEGLSMEIDPIDTKVVMEAYEALNPWQNLEKATIMFVAPELEGVPKPTDWRVTELKSDTQIYDNEKYILGMTMTASRPLVPTEERFSSITLTN